MSFAVTVVLGQEYLPHRLGIASGVMLGTAIGVGGVAAVLLGALADAAGLTAVMWTIAVLPIPALLLALSLPRAPRPATVHRAAAAAEAGVASAPR
jgi:MFS transporter, FSR family, fosmidomycin resistance protein